MRLNSSSGGAFTLIAEYVLNLGGVVFGASFDEKLNVVHKFIEKPEQLELLRRSKYVESFIGESYKQALQFLKAGRLVLFSGVQCQIHALNSFLRKPYENLISVEVICNSVPSAKVWDIYKESLELELGENLEEFNFRGKNFGWEDYCIIAKTKTKEKIIPNNHSPYLFHSWHTHTITRKSCANCYAKGFVSGADFTLGDFWGIRAWHADFVDDKGVSCVLAHTQKALNILNVVQEKCLLQKTRSSLVVAGNPALVYSNPLNPQRNLVLKEFFALYQQSKSAKKAVEFLKTCTNNPRKNGFLQHYYRVYKDDPIRRAISKVLKRLQKAIFKPKEKK